MIIDDFLVINENGIYCRAGDFYLDPVKPCAHAVVSHAHGDHAVRGNATVYCTEATAAFMRHRYQKNAGGMFVTRGFEEPFYCGDVGITFYPAGHILGSAQVLMEHKGVKYLYTGDYKLQADSTCEQIVFAEADVLITETTFADPSLRHPDPEEEIRKINGVPHNILLGAYALGKSQRLISLINDHCPGRNVFVHHSIFSLNRIYEDLGFSPGRYELYNRKAMRQPGNNSVYLVPPLTFDSYIRATNVVRAFASGWEKLQVRNGLHLLISDHVDWPDILTTLGHVKPKEVWTLHGDGRALRSHFRNQIPVKLLNAC